MPVDAKIRVYVTAQLGPKRALTPEGFLLCSDVPIARTGEQIYGPDEILDDDGNRLIQPGSDGLIYINREESEVFNPDTIASFNGKPVTNDHPLQEVTPENWSELAVGTVLHPRREGGLLVADLLITRPDAISAINDDGKVEVSCGYDADYEQTGVGRGRQTSIRGNHVALVDAARCGKTCSIGDKSFIERKNVMSTMKDFVRRIRDGFAKDGIKLKDCSATENTLKEAEQVVDAETAVYGRSDWTDEKLAEKFASYDNMHSAYDTRFGSYDSRFSSYDEKFTTMSTQVPMVPAGDEAPKEEEKKDEPVKDEETEAMTDEVPEEVKEKAAVAKDSAYLEPSFQSTVSLAEIIAPGIRVPTFDRKADPKKTFVNDICGLRRKAIQAGTKDSATADIITEVRGGKSLSDAELLKMSCSKVKDLFLGVAAIKRRTNNDVVNRNVGNNSGTQQRRSPNSMGGMTVAELNEFNRKFYSGR